MRHVAWYHSPVLLLVAAISAGHAEGEPPLCSSCADWCAGRCAFAGPPGSTWGMGQNLTIYRMTAANVTDLDNKNTGNPSGDMIFNMVERATPMLCRHGSSSGRPNPTCAGSTTQGWLLQSSLVYLQWDIEVDGLWGPYLPCNLNISVPPGDPGNLNGSKPVPGDQKWHCVGGRFNGNFSDSAACNADVCPRTRSAVGWEDENSSLPAESTYRHKRKGLSSRCKALADQLCRAQRKNFSTCLHCIDTNRTNRALFANNSCPTYQLVEPKTYPGAFCHAPANASVACIAEARRLCSGFAVPSLWRNCTNCLEHNEKDLLAVCGLDAWLGLVEHQSANLNAVCPVPSRHKSGACGGWNTNSAACSNDTWIGWEPNHHKIAWTLGGSWFSTTSEGRCRNRARPGDGSGCSWRPIQLRKAVNYSCLQSNVAAAVIRHNMPCFARCPDGTKHDPTPAPTDCWLKCFFNTFLGNVTLGYKPMDRELLLKAWAQSFQSDDPLDGGCPAVRVPILPEHPLTRAQRVIKTDDLGSSGRRPGTDPAIDSRRSPFYADPLFDSAHDAEFVWSELEQCWWMTYLQNRYNVPDVEPAGPCPYCSYTDIGLASTPDRGRTWIYRGVARGLDVPPELRHDKTNKETQQFGGATWYRPAVFQKGDLYHGFWVYWEPLMGLLGNSAIGNGVIHYTSRDLKNWTYAGVVSGDTGYDSVVFQIRDGRYVLISAHERNGTSYQSTDLYTWEPTTDLPDLRSAAGEGPHVTDFAGHKWLNTEGSFLMRSDDGGVNWVQLTALEQSLWPFTGTGSRRYDIGLMHQGPIFVQGVAPNERAYYLYFTEFPLNTSWCKANGLQTSSGMDTFGFMQTGCERSVLNLAEVHYAPNVTGGPALSVNRNQTFEFTMVPPNSQKVTPQQHPTVWSIAVEDAMVIALAELNRWVPTALYDLSVCSNESLPAAGAGMPTCGPPPPPVAPGCRPPSCVKNTIVDNFRIADGFYTSYSRLTAAGCVAECIKNASHASSPCTGVIWKAANASGLSACGTIGSTCCYFMKSTRVEDSNCGGACATAWQWKSWSSEGLRLTPPLPPPSSRRLANPQRLWRNPDLAHQYFSSAVSEGTGPQLVWHLQFDWKDATTKAPLDYTFLVHGNGTILEVKSGGRLLTPIKQFFRPTIGPVKSDDESLKINAGSISAGHAQEEHLALQGSTVTATGGGRVWVLVGKPLLNASVVEVVGASGQVVTAARIDSAYGNLKLVSVPPGLPPAAYRLSFSVQDTANNTSSTISTKIISRPVNAPEPHWVTPRGRVGDVLAVYGRRLRREGSSAVSLVEATNLHLQRPKIRVVVFVENENRATFVLPSLTPGSYKVQYSDDWGEWDLPESLTVLAPKPVAHRMVNASLPPFSADASGKVDASGAIVAALKAAGSGGTVTLGAGVFLLVPNRTTEHSGCHAMDAAICLPPSKGALPVTLQGLGAGITTLQQGATAQISFWGSAVSLSDLTLTDKLPEGQEPAIPAGSYQARSLWSFNTYAAWAFNTTDVSFLNVHFIASRNHSNALHLRYIRTVVIFNCTFDYTGVQLSGPLLDVQLLQSRARLQSQWSTGFIQNGVGGRISSTVVANTTVTGLVPQEQSTIAGRFHQAQGYWEYFYVAGNVNERASPGDLHHDTNQGEQFCWESGGAENDARARVVRANHAQPSITVDTLPANTLTALLVQQGGIESGAKQVWDKRYGTGSGGVAVISGTGAGQVRRMLDIMPDNRTLLLDQAFSISPDETSVVSVFLTWVYSAIIRDNRFVGARKQVDQEPHTAACMIPLWGRASTVDFINNHARDIRGTMYLEVNPNLTVTDHIIRDTFSNYTRYGIRMQNEPYKGQLSLIINIENYTLHNVVEYGHKAIAACKPGQYPGHYPGKPGQYSDTCTGDRAGGVAISGLKVVNATTAFLVEPNNPGHDIPGIIPPASNPEFEGNGLAVYSLQQFSFSGGGVGAQIAGSLANETFADGHIDGFDINVNCSDGVNCSLLTRSLLPPVDGPRSTPCGSDAPVVTVALDDVEANRSFWVFGHAFAVGGKTIDGKSPIFNVQQLSSGQEQQAEILSLIVNTTDCSSSALLVLPTFTTSGHSGGPYSLVVKTSAGASSSTLLGAATVDWASPFTVNLKAGDSRYNGCAHAVYGRSLTTFETPVVELKNKTDTVVTCTVLERTESRVCFACQDVVTPGTYTVTLCGHAGGRRLCTDGKATTESISDPEAQHKRRVINASQVKYNLDPHGTKDATLGLRQALVDATNDGREPGGLVVLGPGTFLLDPHSHPSPRLDNCAICRLGATHSVHLVGAGINNTTLLVGPNTDAAFAAAQVGLENLTVADTPAADGTVNGFAVNGSSIRALWTMTKLTVIPPGEKTPASSTDSIEMAKYEGADIRFKNVRFLSHRVGCGLAIRYMKRVQVDSCVFEGGNINVWGPVIDVRLTNNIALMNCDGAGHSSKLYNSSGLGCGGFIDALGWGGAGHASDLVIANNSVWHLLPKEKSRFPGRFFVGQNRFLRRLYIAGNTNHMAGPGALSDQNKGEQVLLEVVSADASTRVVASSGTQLTLDETHSTVLDEYRNRVGLLNDGSTSALGWQYFAGIGTVHVSAGRGVGQWRTVLNIFGNNTIQLDKPFTVSPNRDSRIVLAGSSAHNIIVRDNFFSGEFAKEHVTDVPHVATAAVFMWGNTQRYTAVNNTANWIRTTIDLFAYGNTSQADVLIKDTLSTGATRSLIQANFALQSAVTGQTVRHVQAKQAYFAGMEFHPNLNCHEPCHEPPVTMNSGHGLGISFEDIAVGATPFGITMGSKPHRAQVDGTMLQAFVRNSSFYGSTRTIDGNWTWGEPVGIWHNLSFAAGLHFDGLQLHNFQQNLAGSLPVSSSIHILGLHKLQTEVSSTLDEAAFGDSIVQGHSTWKLKVENMGLLDANVTVSGLPAAAKVMAPTAQLAAFGGAATFGIVLTKPATACGKVCADDSSNCLPFCVEAGAEAGSNHQKLKTDDTVHPPPPPPPPPPLLPCPCNDTSLCQSLPPMKQRPPGDEVIAFSSWEFSGEPPYGSWTAPRHFDWDKITVFAPFDDIDRVRRRR